MAFATGVTKARRRLLLSQPVSPTHASCPTRPAMVAVEGGLITPRWGQSPMARSIMALISAANGSAAQPHRHVAMIGHSKKLRLVIPDGPSRMNNSGKMTASRMPLSPWA